MKSVVVTGAAGPSAEIIVEVVACSPRFDTTRVIAPAPRGPHAAPLDDSTVMTVGELCGMDLSELFQGADAVVHLGGAVDATNPHLLAPGQLVAEARAVLAAAAEAGVGTVVIVSSALVYGAAATNAVPLTEQSVLHPSSGFGPAVEFAEIERLVGDWRDGHDDTDVIVLRCAPVVSDEFPGWLAAELHRAFAYPVEGRDPQTQYLHASDLGRAIVVALDGEIERVANVAPDGWLNDVDRRALDTRPLVRVPAVVADRAAKVLSLVIGSSAPQGVMPYASFSWVVSNDLVRQAGWSARHGNDEAYVSAFRAAPWSMVSSSRRQEMALGAVGAAFVGGVIGVGALVARRRQR